MTKDVLYPYADGTARLQLMYQLPLPRGNLQLVQVCDEHWHGNVWRGKHERLSVADLLRGCPDEAAQFDAVAIPGVLDQAQSGAQASTILRAAHRLLRPGGALVGHCENSMAVRVLCRVSGWRRLARVAVRFDPVASVGGCNRAMSLVGFKAIQCSYVQPHLADPMGLIPTASAASRAQFLRATRAERGHFSPLAYAARIGLAWAGLGGVQQQHLFFWGYKSC